MGIWTSSVFTAIPTNSKRWWAWLRPGDLHQSYTHLTIFCIICFQRPPRNSDLEAWDVGCTSVLLRNPWDICCVTRTNNHWFRGWRRQVFKVRLQQQLLPTVPPSHHKHFYTWINFSFLKSLSTSSKTSNFVFMIDEKSLSKWSRKTKMSHPVGTHESTQVEKTPEASNWTPVHSCLGHVSLTQHGLLIRACYLWMKMKGTIHQPPPNC